MLSDLARGRDDKFRILAALGTAQPQLRPARDHQELIETHA